MKIEARRGNNWWI